MHNMRVTDTCKTQALICHEEVNRCVELPVELWKTFLLIGDNVDEGHTSSIYSIAIGPQIKTESEYGPHRLIIANYEKSL